MDGEEGASEYWGVVSIALIAAAAGYLFTTARGRQICNEAIELIDTFSFECARFWQAATRAQVAAAAAWRAVQGTVEATRPPAD